VGSYAECWVGSFYVGSTKNHIDPGLIELFRSSDKCVVPVTGEQLPRILTRWAQFVDEDELTTVFYRTPVKVARERLDLLGYTLAAARRAFNISLAAQVRESERRVGGAHGALFERDHRVLSTLDVDSWLATLRHIKAAGLPPHFNHPTNNWDGTLLGYMLLHDWYGYEGPDQNVGLRLALEVCADDDDFVYDVTGLVLGGECDAEDDLVASAIATSATSAARSGKTVVLTEGVTDSRILAASLQLLRPHLADYFSFMDFETARVGGGAGNLVNLVKAFAGAGIMNRIIALFDNDTAARAALKALEMVALPGNIRVIQLPPLDLLRQYPTLGPSGEAVLDVNGIAASIELYLGVDVLQQGGGSLAPVQWTGLDGTLRRYQGEVVGKPALHERFFARLDRCRADASRIAETDWTGIEAILHQLLAAFREADEADVCACLDAYYQEESP
jgi:hypothetical protein